MKVIVIGQAPSRLSDPSRPLSGKIGGRLAALAGLSHAEFLARFECLNLLERWPGKDGKGDAFPKGEAKLNAFYLRSIHFRGGRRIVLLGRQVAGSFGWTGSADLLRWMPDLSSSVAICPHPSGIIRWWNEPANEERARRFWLDLARESKPGP